MRTRRSYLYTYANTRKLLSCLKSSMKFYYNQFSIYATLIIIISKCHLNTYQVPTERVILSPSLIYYEHFQREISLMKMVMTTRKKWKVILSFHSFRVSHYYTSFHCICNKYYAICKSSNANENNVFNAIATFTIVIILFYFSLFRTNKWSVLQSSSILSFLFFYTHTQLHPNKQIMQ